jgi:hypothetical protein
MVERERGAVRSASSAGCRAIVELLLRAPSGTPHAEAFSRVCQTHGVGADLLLTIPQVEAGGRWLDTKDRVPLGAALLRDLVNAGL